MNHDQGFPSNRVIPLRAGVLTLQYDNGDIRYLRVGKHEILQRVYVAVRDHNWGTIPAHITVHDLVVEPDSFTIRYHAEHQQGDIHFSWDGEIIGGVDSSLRFIMDGRALSTFLRNRIGFCVLHPMTCAGAPCVVEQVDSGVVSTAFPVEIAPHQPFLNMRAITHQLAPGLHAEVRFSGEIFEMEDQRNWTDASFKTYCTPLELPFPVEITAGTQVQQAVTVRLQFEAGAETGSVRDEAAPTLLTIEPETLIGRLPHLGVCAAVHQRPLTTLEIARLKLLHLNHLRVDVRFAQPDWQQRLLQNLEESQQLGVALEVALHLTEGADGELAALRRLLDDTQPKPTIATWLLFSNNWDSTPPEVTAIARRYLEDYAPSTLFAGGTDAFFVQLNRNRPSVEGLDLLTYSINPQVHAFDNASLVETLSAQAVTLASGERFSGGRGLVVSPVTLKMRFNPANTRADPPSSPDALPPQVDPRQRLLFGAGWTLGSIKYLSEGRAHSVTYYETTGWLGVMEQENPLTRSAQFPAKAGEVFPLFHVLADVGEWRDAEIVRTNSNGPLSADLFVLRRGNSLRILVANFRDSAQAVELQGVQGEGTLRRLDERTMAQAADEPEAFRAQTGEHRKFPRDGLLLELAPFAVIRLDLAIL